MERFIYITHICLRLPSVISTTIYKEFIASHTSFNKLTSGELYNNHMGII